MRNIQKKAWFKLLGYSLALIILWISSGCSMKTKIIIATNPDGAKVFVNNNYVGESPVIYKGSATKEIIIKAKKECYGEEIVIYRPEWDFGCVIFYFLLGLPTLGAMFILIPGCKEFPDTAYLKLEKDMSCPPTMGGLGSELKN